MNLPERDESLADTAEEIGHGAADLVSPPKSEAQADDEH